MAFICCTRDINYSSSVRKNDLGKNLQRQEDRESSAKVSRDESGRGGKTHFSGQYIKKIRVSGRIARARRCYLPPSSTSNVNHPRSLAAKPQRDNLMLGPINARVQPRRPSSRDHPLASPRVAWIWRCTWKTGPAADSPTTAFRLSSPLLIAGLMYLAAALRSPSRHDLGRENENFMSIVSISQKVTLTGKLITSASRENGPSNAVEQFTESRMFVTRTSGNILVISLLSKFVLNLSRHYVLLNKLHINCDITFRVYLCRIFTGVATPR